LDNCEGVKKPSVFLFDHLHYFIAECQPSPRAVTHVDHAVGWSVRSENEPAKVSILGEKYTFVIPCQLGNVGIFDARAFLSNGQNFVTGLPECTHDCHVDAFINQESHGGAYELRCTG